MNEFQLRNIRPYDEATHRATLSYLLENPRPGVRSRPEDQLNQALHSGLPIIVRRAGALCACSFVYDFSTPGDAPVFSEIGTMLVTANGFGLQWFIACLHLFQLRLENYPDNNHISFAVVGPDTDSEHVLKEKAGLKPWNPPVSLVSLRATAGTPFAADKRVLLADAETIKKARASLREWHLKDNLFRTPKQDGRIEIDMGWFDPQLLNLADF